MLITLCITEKPVIAVVDVPRAARIPGTETPQLRRKFRALRFRLFRIALVRPDFFLLVPGAIIAGASISRRGEESPLRTKRVAAAEAVNKFRERIVCAGNAIGDNETN